MPAHKDPGATKSTLWYFGFRIFYAHILCAVAMVILALMAMLLQNVVNYTDRTMTLIVNVFTFALYAFLVYRDSWSIGLHDFNRVLYDRAVYDRFKPVKAVLASQSVGVLLAVWVALAPSSPDAETFANYFYANFRFPLEITSGTTLGRYLYFTPWIFAGVFAVWGYFNGYKQKRVTDKLVYRAKSK
ncbi:MAG: hypothetical protein LBD85_02525 [Oscillospiraceae bacterium]|jgi:hypothetical protein|nr:hypothetical protein [Oscillospiraceae bacterium]